MEYTHTLLLRLESRQRCRVTTGTQQVATQWLFVQMVAGTIPPRHVISMVILFLPTGPVVGVGLLNVLLVIPDLPDILQSGITGNENHNNTTHIDQSRTHFDKHPHP